MYFWEVFYLFILKKVISKKIWSVFFLEFNFTSNFDTYLFIVFFLYNIFFFWIIVATFLKKIAPKEQFCFSWYIPIMLHFLASKLGIRDLRVMEGVRSRIRYRCMHIEYGQHHGPFRVQQPLNWKKWRVSRNWDIALCSLCDRQLAILWNRRRPWKHLVLALSTT